MQAHVLFWEVFQRHKNVWQGNGLHRRKTTIRFNRDLICKSSDWLSLRTREQYCRLSPESQGAFSPNSQAFLVGSFLFIFAHLFARVFYICLFTQNNVAVSKASSEQDDVTDYRDTNQAI